LIRERDAAVDIFLCLYRGCVAELLVRIELGFLRGGEACAP
jgi:hypothetical protein